MTLPVIIVASIIDLPLVESQSLDGEPATGSVSPLRSPDTSFSRNPRFAWTYVSQERSPQLLGRSLETDSSSFFNLCSSTLFLHLRQRFFTFRYDNFHFHKIPKLLRPQEILRQHTPMIVVTIEARNHRLHVILKNRRH